MARKVLLHQVTRALNQMAGEKLKSKRVRRRQVKHMFNAYVISLPRHHQGVE